MAYAHTNLPTPGRNIPTGVLEEQRIRGQVVHARRTIPPASPSRFARGCCRVLPLGSAVLFGGNVSRRRVAACFSVARRLFRSIPGTVVVVGSECNPGASTDGRPG